MSPIEHSLSKAGKMNLRAKVVVFLVILQALLSISLHFVPLHFSPWQEF